MANIGHFKTCTLPESCLCKIKRFGVILCIGLIIFISEYLGGIYTNSLALIGDAWHVFGDNIAIAAAICAEIFIIVNPIQSEKIRLYTFYILVGILMFIIPWIGYEAYDRLNNQEEIIAPVMILIATLGGCANFCQHLILEKAAHDHKDEVHQGLSAHILADMMQNVGVVVAGIIIWITKWYVIDLLVTILIMIWLTKQVRTLIQTKGKMAHHH